MDKQTDRQEHGLRALLRALLNAKDTMSYDGFLSLASMKVVLHSLLLQTDSRIM